MSVSPKERRVLMSSDLMVSGEALSPRIVSILTKVELSMSRVSR